MDLPTCPACGQSVIDDDATECPFCGSSMSAPRTKQSPTRPKTAPAAPPPPQKTSAAESASASSPAAPSSASSPTSTKAESPRKEDDKDPFSVDTSAIQKAIPAAPRRVKGRPYRVICPMCETVGYVPVSAAEQEVRCANRECLMPIFTAPKIVRKPVVEEPEPSGLPAVVWVAIVLVLFAAAGGSAWYFVLRKPAPSAIEPIASDPQTTNQNPSLEPPDAAVTNPGNKTGTTNRPADPPPKPLTLAEVRQLILERMISASQEPSQNRSKPYCRQITAQAFAECGDLQGARAQLERLAFVGKAVPFYKVPPLVVIAWKQSQAGQGEAARQTLEEAHQAAQSLPQFGQAAVGSAVGLAGGLAAIERAGDARTLIDRYANEGELARLVTRLKLAYDRGTFDLEDAYAEEPLLPSPTPLWVAVTADLAQRDLWAAAEDWARRHPDATEQARCLAVFLEAAHRALARQNDEALRQRFDQIVGELGPVAQSVVYARISLFESDNGKRAAAQEAVERAKSAFAQLDEPAELTMPDLRGFYEMTLPPAEPLQFAALAASEIARALAQLERTDEAAKFLLTALEYLRSIAPSPSAVAVRVEEIDRLGTNVIRDRLRAALNLDSIDAAEQALRRYRRTCRTIQEASDMRFRLQVLLLARAVGWNLLDVMADETATRVNMDNPDRREPYDRTPLPYLLAAHYRAAGNAAKASEVEQRFPPPADADDLSSQVRWMPELLFVSSAAGLLPQGELKLVADQLQLGRSVGGSVWQDRWSLQFASQLVKDDKLDEAFQLIRHYRDPLLREQSYELIAALATRLGHGRRVLQMAEESKLVPTAEISVLHGVLLGLIAREAATSDQAADRAQTDQAAGST